MAKRSKKKKALDNNIPSPAPSFQIPFLNVWVSLLLAVVTFLIYWPSLKSDLVYDAHIEIIREGFVTSLSNLPAVLTLKVLGMKLMLGARPGQLLYLMLIAAVSGKHALGYHLCSNLLHAANVALMYVVLNRLIATEMAGLYKSHTLKIQLALAAVTLLFALHPIAVESVSEVSYSSSLLVTLFTLLALLAAMAFRPENFRMTMIMGGVGTVCVFASVTCKESGIATPFLLGVYWFLFRRQEAKLPWFLFLGVAMMVTAAFLAARFSMAPSGGDPLGYLGGSFSNVFLIQPCLWVFMMGQLLWPVHLSADYAQEDMKGLSTLFSLIILTVVFSLQGWLSWKSRLGALGVAVYWLGLATVSNLVPLYCPVADRFYYLPMVGVAMQLLALFLMTLNSRWGYWMGVAPLLGVILPLIFLTLTREAVFANEFSLWTDTVQVSPFSPIAHYNLGNTLDKQGKLDEAIAEYRKALKINPDYAEAHNNLGYVLMTKGEVEKGMKEFQEVERLRPDLARQLPK